MVLFRIAGGQIVPEIDMSPNETIFDLKDKIEEELGVCIHRQSLWYHNNELRDDEFIGNYGFRGNPTLSLSVEPLPSDLKIHVLVKHIGGNGYVRVRETDTVSDLRRKVERYWAIPQQLFTLHRLNVEMKDNHPLHAYYVNEASEVQLSVSIEPR